MIDSALKFLRDFLNEELATALNPDPVVLANITKDTDIENDKIHLSLVHIEEEKIGKEVNHQRRINPADTFYTTVNPEIRLNLYILVTYQYNSKNYIEALKTLGNVATVLQGRYVFTQKDFETAPFTAYKELQQVVIDLYTQTLDQSSNLWQAMGEKLAPSLLYKMRVVGIQANEPLAETAEIKAIGINVMHKPVSN